VVESKIWIMHTFISAIFSFRLCAVFSQCQWINHGFTFSFLLLIVKLRDKRFCHYYDKGLYSREIRQRKLSIRLFKIFALSLEHTILSTAVLLQMIFMGSNLTMQFFLIIVICIKQSLTSCIKADFLEQATIISILRTKLTEAHFWLRD
jgi:hypothetical protein